MWGINVTNTRIFCILCHPACGGVILVSPFSPFQPKTWQRDGPTSPSPEMGRRGGGRTGKSAHVEWRRQQKILAVTCWGVGAVQDVQSIIFINLISRSKKVKPKMLTCVWSLCSATKLLRLWHFVSVLNLKFLDQLERRHCKDTPYFRPFYIGLPNRPFLWGLK